MIEKELWGTMPFDKYNTKVELFTKEFGEPRKSKRLALRFGPNERMYINTRIRITDGDAKLMQKVHERDESTADENELDIPNNSDYIINLFKTYKVLLQDFENTHFRLIRFENLIFDTKDYEIKLTHQFGNDEIYSFEVEAKTEDADIKGFCEKYDLIPDPNANSDEFWVEYNKRVNVDVANWSNDQLREVIEEYLDQGSSS
jgi:hypothetical protein